MWPNKESAKSVRMREEELGSVSHSVPCFVGESVLPRDMNEVDSFFEIGMVSSSAFRKLAFWGTNFYDGYHSDTIRN
jgi:hypothetical protein